MGAFSILSGEHRVIEQGLPMMARLDGLGGGEEQVVEFFRTFADACHHHKEEIVLFPAMERRGVPRTQGLLHELLQEHGTGRRMLHEIAGLLHPAQDDFETSRRLLRGRVAAYVSHLRAHIAKEESQLWPLAERVLTADDDAEISAGYDNVEQNEIGMQNYKRYLAWTRQWAA